MARFLVHSTQTTERTDRDSLYVQIVPQNHKRTNSIINSLKNGQTSCFEKAAGWTNEPIQLPVARSPLIVGTVPMFQPVASFKQSEILKTKECVQLHRMCIRVPGCIRFEARSTLHSACVAVGGMWTIPRGVREARCSTDNYA